MHAARAISLNRWLLAAGAALAVVAFVPAANANPIRITFSGTYTDGNNVGQAFHGYADLTLAPAPAASSAFPGVGDVVPGFNAGPPATFQRVDPGNAQSIAGVVRGSFDGQPIVGLAKLNNAPPPPGEYLPASYSGGPLTAPLSNGDGGISFDNLFYADGAPAICLGVNADGTTTELYRFDGGGMLDLFGVMFELKDGNFVDLWSNGVMPGLGLNYGALLLQPSGMAYTMLSGQFNGARVAVPEPQYLWLLGVGLLGLFGWRRWRESRRLADVD